MGVCFLLMKDFVNNIMMEMFKSIIIDATARNELFLVGVMFLVY